MRAVLREIVALFVDDGLYALAIALWLALIGMSVRWFAVPSLWAGPALFVGLAAILLESVLRRARR